MIANYPIKEDVLHRDKLGISIGKTQIVWMACGNS